MIDAKLVSTLFEAHFRLSTALSPQSNDEQEYMPHIFYSSIVGSIMHAMICTRPDISYVVSMVSRYMTNHGKTHWQTVKQILRYLRDTTNTCLEFGRCKNGVVEYVVWLDILIRILQVIWIEGDHFQVIYSPSIDVQLVEKFHYNQLSSCLQPKQYIAITEDMKKAMWLCKSNKDRDCYILI